MIYHGSYKPSSVPLAFEGARSGGPDSELRDQIQYPLLITERERYHG
jgi:hypothetical protein